MPWYYAPCGTTNPDTRAHCTKCGAAKSATPTVSNSFSMEAVEFGPCLPLLTLSAVSLPTRCKPFGNRGDASHGGMASSRCLWRGLAVIKALFSPGFS
ncbi:hypothetical protein BDD12DRAFT_823852 [Trichophaea hybrida]|nr:hypothetical protein BDD12DRAFT_823852 [Trichophaea hybrida]